MGEQPIPYTTRESTRYGADAAGNFHEVARDALSSVEVGQDAKGTSYVKSAKAYHNDPLEAARLAVAAFQVAQAYLQGKPEEAKP